MKIGPHSMFHNFAYLDQFVIKMKEKIISRNNKYGNSKPTEEQVKQHYIDEIIESFDISISDQIQIRSILKDAKIHKHELVDTANMSWILNYMMEDNL